MKNGLWIFLLCCALSSCEKSEGTRSYTEVSLESQQEIRSRYDPIIDSHASLNFNIETHAEMNHQPHAMGSTDPHAGFTAEQLSQMLIEAQKGQGQNNRPLSWTLPKEWEEKEATGMRVATFILRADPSAMDCSIVTLGSGAGGLSGNIIRWLGQINIPAPSEAEINTFIAQQEILKIKNGGSAQLINFTSLQKSAPLTNASMLAAIIDTPKQRIFVKLTGTKDNVLKQLETFKSFIRSLEIL